MPRIHRRGGRLALEEASSHGERRPRGPSASFLDAEFQPFACNKIGRRWRVALARSLDAAVNGHSVIRRDDARSCDFPQPTGPQPRHYDFLSGGKVTVKTEHIFLINLIQKILNFYQGSRSFTLPCIFQCYLLTQGCEFSLLRHCV